MVSSSGTGGSLVLQRRSSAGFAGQEKEVFCVEEFDGLPVCEGAQEIDACPRWPFSPSLGASGISSKTEERQRRISESAAHRSEVKVLKDVGALVNEEGEGFSSGTLPRRTSQKLQGSIYLQLYACHRIISGGESEFGRRVACNADDAVGEQTVLISLPPAPVSRCGMEQVNLSSPGTKGKSSVPAAPTGGVEIAAALASVATLPDVVNHGGALTVTGYDRFRLMSAENGDLVERDTCAGSPYWAAENRITTYYPMPSVLLQAMERREAMGFRRHSQECEKLLQSSATRLGGAADDALRSSFVSFKAKGEAADQRPIHKRSFYEGPGVDWEKVLREQATEVSSLSGSDRAAGELVRKEGGDVPTQGDEKKRDRRQEQ
ncbi:hypothetical protein LSCM1_05303 [Leishmania martiniquensis]|uniref:Uncharacterized protein n=1 Tax=Leishmania martiniquensis TaxID=1580590 RepID=A0A836GNA6_9TRYP|nr:hypothetical protein LSCM1_05303 [Leishmania martiniquensis]